MWVWHKRVEKLAEQNKNQQPEGAQGPTRPERRGNGQVGSGKGGTCGQITDTHGAPSAYAVRQEQASTPGS